MDSLMGGVVGVGGSRDVGAYNLMKEKRPSYKRLSSDQTTTLEKFIRDCPHPNETQRHQLAAETGLEPKQIKFWFQNKRTQMKNQHEKADNTALRVENDRIQAETRLIRETLMNILCPSCGGPPCREEEHEQYMQRMWLENDRLRIEHEKVSSFLARYLERQMSQPELPALLPPMMSGSSSYAPEFGSSPNQAIDEAPMDLNQNFGSPFLDEDMLLANTMATSVADVEKTPMLEVATTATDELLKLMHINEPLWVKSSIREGKVILNRVEYEKTFPRPNHFKGAYVRVESTKESALVRMDGIELVDMFLDSDKWVNLFPTIVTKAATIHVVETGSLENRSGALHLMYEKMHTLSPLVPYREFRFLRYCQKVGVGEWVITNVSYNPFGDINLVASCWRHPSGCMIQDMHNGYCMVTWIEHVEVDDKTQTHRLFRDIVNRSIAYGAERWIVELQRMCERITLYYVQRIPNHDAGVINSLEGRRSMMNLSHRMVKIFFENLHISNKLDFPHLTVEQNSGIRVSIRNCTELGQPHGVVVIASTSLWLPLPYQQVFEFLTDDQTRFKWDIVSCGNPVQKVANISNGSHPSNCTSIIQPIVPTENNVLILQESFIDPMGSYVVYAPTDVTAFNSVSSGEDSTLIPILPCGFVISGDGKSNAVSGASNNQGGSLLTVALQILVCTLSGMEKLDVESVSTVNTILNLTIEKIKDGLNCSSLE